MNSILAVLTMLLIAGGCASKSKTEQGADNKKSPSTNSQASQAKTSNTDSAAGVASSTVCQSKGDKRVLEIRGKGKGCELGYSKFGKEDIVASAMSGNAHCESVLSRIREKLVGAGYACE